MISISVPEGLTGEAVAKRAFFLAFQACGGPTGMGVLQDNPGATEDDVWKNVLNSGDYVGEYMTPKTGEPYGDYVFGRMMKLGLTFTADTVSCVERAPRIDYQGWCRKYPSYEALVQAAISDLTKTVET